MAYKVILFIYCFIAFCYGVSLEKASRIVGGEVTSIEQYPYAAAVLTNSGLGIVYRQVCGGTILTNRVVLSVASCFGGGWFPVSQWRIRVGSSYGSSGGEVYGIRFYAMHIGYSPLHGRDDIMLLQTSSEIAYSSNVSPAQLAGAGYVLPNDEVVWAIGWGYSEQSGYNNDVLREVDVLVISHEECSRLYPYSVTGLEQMCTGWLEDGGKDNCFGDEGSPLIHKGSSGDVVVGICSWGRTCGRPETPGVSTRVSEYAAWIVRTVWVLNNS